MKCTVIVDTQNAYGSSGDALGQREKPTPEGVVAAFRSIGFDVHEVRIAVALPDHQDCERAAADLLSLRRGLSRLANDINALALPSELEPQVWACVQRLRSAESACIWQSSGSALRDRLDLLNRLATNMGAELAPAERDLVAATDALSAVVGRSSGVVPSGWVASMRTLVQGVRRLQVFISSVRSTESFAYAGCANVDYHASLPPAASGASVRILEGRFRPGRDGQNPGEKQVDTLCAVACVEATTKALDEPNPCAVIVLSDDDDLTPALEHAAELASGGHVRVVVAGTSAVFRRHSDSAASRGRPRWITLDASMWCLLVGQDPATVHAQRNSLAKMALGNPGAFTVAGGTPVSGLGLRAKLAYRDADVEGQVVLSAMGFSWGKGRANPIPSLLVARSASQPRDVARARVRRAQGTRVGLRHLPLDQTGTEIEAVLGVPGWWMAGDEVVVASVEVRDRVLHRVLGHAPGYEPPGPVASARLARVVSATGPWADVEDAGTTWSVYVGPGVDLHRGDKVVICPFERSGRTGPGGKRFPPRAILLSSAL